jgi:hypothetical protein
LASRLKHVTTAIARKLQREFIAQELHKEIKTRHKL